MSNVGEGALEFMEVNSTDSIGTNQWVAASAARAKPAREFEPCAVTPVRQARLLPPQEALYHYLYPGERPSGVPRWTGVVYLTAFRDGLNFALFKVRCACDAARIVCYPGSLALRARRGFPDARKAIPHRTAVAVFARRKKASPDSVLYASLCAGPSHLIAHSHGCGILFLLNGLYYADQ